MLNNLQQLANERKSIVNGRKLLLFCVACYRTQIATAGASLASAVAEATEAIADGQAEYSRIHHLWQEAERAVRTSRKNYATVCEDWEGLAYSFVAQVLSVTTPGITREQRATRSADAAARVIDEVRKSSSTELTGARRKQAVRVAEAALCKSLRDIFGNPFHPVEFSLSWRTGTAFTLAGQMYESRDFSAMPILADALQDSGCDNADILDHCRGPGLHVRGCWVVDLVLGRE
jgi:hypothetical protein